MKDSVDTVAASASTSKMGVPLAKLFLTLLTTPEVIGALTTLGIMLSKSEGMTKLAGATATKSASWLKNILK
ncbi:MAG: hypothetical protein GX028_04825 [Clostridiaceae bacterium]|nr:hypothetical protein [Clostridiaceae bacterium]